MQCVQYVFLSASLERNFLVGRPNSVKPNVANSMQCDTNQRKIKKRNNTTKKKGTYVGSTRGFLRKCQPPAWQRFPSGSERQEREGRNARPKRRERSRIANATKHTSKEKKKKQCIPPHQVEAKGNGARKVRAHCSIVRLAKRREGLGAQSLADHSNLLLAGCRAFVLDETKRLQDVGPRGHTEL